MNPVVAALRLEVLLVVLTCMTGLSNAQSDRQNSPYGRCRAEAIDKRIIKCSRWMRTCNSTGCTYDTVCEPRDSSCEGQISFGHMVNTGPRYCDTKYPGNNDDDIDEVVDPICKNFSKAPDSTTSGGAPEPAGSSGPTVSQVIFGLALIDRILSAGGNEPQGTPGAFVAPAPQGAPGAFVAPAPAGAIVPPAPAGPPTAPVPPAAPGPKNVSAADVADLLRRFRDSTLAKGESPCIEVATNTELTRLFAAHVTKASTVVFCFGSGNDSKLFALDQYVKFTVKGMSQMFELPLHAVLRIFSRETRDQLTFKW